VRLFHVAQEKALVVCATHDSMPHTGLLKDIFIEQVLIHRISSKMCPYSILISERIYHAHCVCIFHAHTMQRLEFFRACVCVCATLNATTKISRS